ncbi:hypothetical protein C8J56DRAFT_1163994 [Mycena floridula]|nr:hypothetical protein C8J56DRAFT_1163994 [Mycena floridula]
MTQNKKKMDGPPKITAYNGFQQVISRTDFMSQWRKPSPVTTHAPAPAPPVPVRRKGKLSLLPSLPLDILFEVFSHLLPMDVLNLARTTKELRRVLMRRSALSIWKAALAEVPELPECPADMSLPGWVNLAFSLHCHSCLTTNVRTVYWQNRTRLCSKCAKALLISEDSFDKRDKKDKIILNCIPFDKAGSSRYCTVKRKLAFVKELNQMTEDRTEFVEKKCLEMSKLSDHADNCQAWLRYLELERAQELAELRVQRRKDIEARLVGLGHKAEIDYLNDIVYRGLWVDDLVMLGELPEVKQPKALTDRMWSNMKEDMLEYMKIVKAHRLKIQRLQLIADRMIEASEAWFNYRRDNCEAGDFLPGQLDIWLLDPIRKAIDSPGDDMPRFSSILNPILPDIINKWREERLFKLRYMAMPEGIPWTNTDDHLKLAVVVISCTGSSVIHESDEAYDENRYPAMWYPEFIHHSCNAICSEYDTKDDEVIPHLKPRDCQTLHFDHGFSDSRPCRRKLWSPELLTFDSKASVVVKNILDGCGLDYRTTTVEELDKLDPRLVCLKCSFGAKIDGDRMHSVWTWRKAVQHCMKQHWGDRGVKWQRVSEEDNKAAKVLEANEPVKRGIPGPKFDVIWRCTRCQGKQFEPGLLNKLAMHQHLDNHHDTELIEGEDYFRAKDQPPVQPMTIKMVVQKAFVVEKK